MPPEPLAIDESKLTPLQALGVALSVTIPTMKMDAAQQAARPMLAHLKALGFTVERTGARTIKPGEPDHPLEVMKRATKGDDE